MSAADVLAALARAGTVATRAERVQRGREDLAAVAHELEAEELQVLVLLARRLLLGQREHGVLDVASDPRDWVRERGEEVQDLLVYTCIAELKRTLRAREPIG